MNDVSRHCSARGRHGARRTALGTDRRKAGLFLKRSSDRSKRDKGAPRRSAAGEELTIDCTTQGQDTGANMIDVLQHCSPRCSPCRGKYALRINP